jgi:hypothetical protein
LEELELKIDLFPKNQTKILSKISAQNERQKIFPNLSEKAELMMLANFVTSVSTVIKTKHSQITKFTYALTLLLVEKSHNQTITS